MMNVVPRERLELIERWNEGPIVLRADHVTALEAIGPTPSDPYGNQRGLRETPCAVTTVTGERIDLAIVSVQRHAPFEHWRSYRLANEMAEVHPSRYALPLEVRVATSRARELRMGFAPTIAKLPTGERVAFNGPQNFFVREGVAASDIVLSRSLFQFKKPQPIHPGDEVITYFVAD